MQITDFVASTRVIYLVFSAFRKFVQARSARRGQRNVMALTFLRILAENCKGIRRKRAALCSRVDRGDATEAARGAGRRLCPAFAAARS
jgi:hypothetical protein